MKALGRYRAALPLLSTATRWRDGGPARRLLVFLTAAAMSRAAAVKTPPREPAQPAPKISYYREIRPILQANCQGCHQPAKAKGGYAMTDFKRLLAASCCGVAALS